MDPDYELNVPRYHDFQNDSVASYELDREEFNSFNQLLMSPDLKKQSKENLEFNIRKMKKDAFGIDLSKLQKGAQPGGIGDFSKISLFNRKDSRIAQRARRRSQQVFIEPDPEPTKPVISRKNSFIPVPIKPAVRRNSICENPAPVVARRNSIISDKPAAVPEVQNRRRSGVASALPPSNIVLRSRNDVVLSQRQASNRLPPQPTHRRQSFGLSQEPKPALPPAQAPITRRRSGIQPVPDVQNVSKKRIEPVQPSNQGPVTRRRSFVKEDPVEVVVPPPVSRPRRRSLLGSLPNLPPLSSILASKHKVADEATQQNSQNKPVKVASEAAPMISRRYATRSATNR